MIGVEEEIVFTTDMNRKPVAYKKNGGDVLVFPHLPKDPCSAVLDILEPLEVLPGIPMKSALQ